MELLGPKGWSCAAFYGADGSGGITVYPPGAGQSSPAAIDGSETSACFGCTLGQACPLFPDAAKAYRTGFGQACPTRPPAAETVTPITAGIVSFEDPRWPHLGGPDRVAHDRGVNGRPNAIQYGVRENLRQLIRPIAAWP